MIRARIQARYTRSPVAAHFETRPISATYVYNILHGLGVLRRPPPPPSLTTGRHRGRCFASCAARCLTFVSSFFKKRPATKSRSLLNERSISRRNHRHPCSLPQLFCRGYFSSRKSGCRRYESTYGAAAHPVGTNIKSICVNYSERCRAKCCAMRGGVLYPRARRFANAVEKPTRGRRENLLLAARVFRAFVTRLLPARGESFSLHTQTSSSRDAPLWTGMQDAAGYRELQLLGVTSNL